mmetsp:Transcript_32986/g.105058  ORF Transcript_32986/g.105058 Transcript_32986/m.105058 type:complete len:205 (-) Transcript_32986:744-1358(-)
MGHEGPEHNIQQHRTVNRLEGRDLEEAFPLMEMPGSYSRLHEGAGSPEESASLLSKLTSSWAAPLVYAGHRKFREGTTIAQEDLWPLCHEDKAEVAGRRFAEAWHRECAQRGPDASVIVALLRLYRRQLLLISAECTCFQLLQLGSVYCLHEIVGGLEDRSGEGRLYPYSFGLGLFPILGNCFFQNAFWRAGHLIVQRVVPLRG